MLEGTLVRIDDERLSPKEAAMATQPTFDLPEGFETLSKEEQVEYVQRLWDRIASEQDSVPVPDWHREVLRQRLETRVPENDPSWEVIREDLTGDCDE